jgi:hypothetical protein
VRSDSKEDTGNKDLQDPEDEETKKKFKPEEHDWFDVDLPADTFTQFFCQMHECSNVSQRLRQTVTHWSQIYPVDLNRHFKGIHAEMEDGADKYYKMDYQMSSEEDVNEQLIR